MIWLFLSCSDYNLFKEQVQEQEPSLLPLLDVQPPGMDAGVVCDSSLQNQQSTHWINLVNLGEAPLEISALESTGNWGIVFNPTPITLQPGDYYPINLIAADGEGLLIVQSNDENAVQQFPLKATADQQPSIFVDSPFEGEIIDGEMLFLATVSDDFDPPQNLMAQWRSNVDGLFSSASPNANGELIADWNSFHTSGYHVLEVMVMDSCQNRSTEIVRLCQQNRYEMDAFDISSWHFEGAARYDTDNNWVELTSVVENTVGTAFSISQEVPGGSVDIEFQFYIGDGTGADGISLTALDVDRMSTFLGGAGCGIGYGGDAPCTLGPALPGWSIEVDTHYNSGQDPTPNDHLMFTFDGDVDDPALWVDLPKMEDTGWHTMHVSVQEPHVFVEIDGIAYIDDDIPGFYNFDAYVGFTAGTGGQTNNHLIDALVVQEQVCGD